jgi:hypothetical protein
MEAELTTDEYSLIRERRAQAAMEAGPLQEHSAVAIIVLRSLRSELDGIANETGKVTLFDMNTAIDRWLGILGADGKESGSASPGPGR